MNGYIKTERVPSRGFSLIELMIALMILGVIVSQLFVLVTTQQQRISSESEQIGINEQARVLLDQIAFEARNAGMLVPRELAVSSVDGDTDGPDRFCTSDGGVFVIPPPGTDPFWDNLGDRFPGSNGTISGTVLTLSSFDIDGRGAANDFSVNAGVIVARADGSATWCARILSFGGAPPTQMTLSDSAPPAVAGTVVAVPAVVYEVNGTTISRNNLPFTAPIEDLQIQYWVDNAGPQPNGVIDGTAEWPIDDLNNMLALNTSRIRRVRIYLTARSTMPDTTGGKAMDRHNYPGVANRTAGATFDAFAREVFSASVLPRNLLDSGEIPDLP
jgi:prepilin-type N-terminal cleavage/methylation domain-containing protein